MNWKEFFKLTKVKIIYLIVIVLILLISGNLAQNAIYCLQAPCNQSTSTIVSQKIYSIVTFNELFVNTKFALQFKNLLQPFLSANLSYLIFSFIISIVLHYIIISLIVCIYKYYKKRRK